MGDKQQPPKLPKGAPDNLTKFVSCESPKLTWTAGKIDWLKIKDLLPKDFPARTGCPTTPSRRSRSRTTARAASTSVSESVG